MTETDIIIIGAGLAGVSAAHAADEKGARTLIVDRGAIGIGNNSTMAGGWFAAPTSSYSAEEYIKDTMAIGQRLNDKRLVETVAREAPEAFRRLSSLGFSLEETAEYFVYRPQKDRILTCLTMMSTLKKGLESMENIETLSGFYVTDILKRSNRVIGVKGFDRIENERSFTAESVILATGGGGGLYSRTDNHRNALGQGHYLAAKAGLELQDMEFVQFYPVIANEAHLPPLCLSPPQGAVLINSAGDDILKNRNITEGLEEASMKKRDELSRIIFRESQSGPVYMDCRAVAAAMANESMATLKKLKFNLEKRPVEITTGAHFFMGGVPINERAETNLPGLFACGEVACGLHGANRRGGNALTECLVFGRIAGQTAAENAGKNRTAAAVRNDCISIPVARNEISEEKNDLRELQKKEMKALSDGLKNIAWNKIGVIRNEKELKAAVVELNDVEERIKTIQPENKREMVQKEDLKASVFILRAIATASLKRRKNIGAFYRSDLS